MGCPFKGSYINIYGMVLGCFCNLLNPSPEAWGKATGIIKREDIIVEKA